MFGRGKLSRHVESELSVPVPLRRPRRAWHRRSAKADGAVANAASTAAP